MRGSTIANTGNELFFVKKQIITNTSEKFIVLSFSDDYNSNLSDMFVALSESSFLDM
jgi:hypothetical protein